MDEGDPIPQTEVEDLEVLMCNNFTGSFGPIENLDGIEHFTGLDRLYLHLHRFGQDEFDKLSELTGLEALGVSSNGITNIDFLDQFTELTSLDASNNTLESLEPLSDLTQLESLNIWGTGTPDLNVLSNLSNLNFLNLSGQTVDDTYLAALENFTALETLSMEAAGLTSADVLPEMENLTSLLLSDNHIADLSPLSELNLTTLEAERQFVGLGPVTAGQPIDNPIVGVNGDPVVLDHPSYDPALNTFIPTAGDSGTTWEVEDLAGFDEYAFTGTLAFTAVEAIDISDPALLECVNTALGQDPADAINEEQAAGIVSLTCEDMGIEDLTGIDNLTSLSFFGAADNNIVDLSPLTALGGMATGVDLSGNLIEDVTPLSTMQFGEVLDLRGNRITDVSPLNQWFDARDQVVDLGDILIDEAHENPVVDLLGNVVPLEALYDADTNTFTPTSLGAGEVEWTGPDGEFGVIFTGTLQFTAVEAEEEEPPADPVEPVEPVEPEEPTEPEDPQTPVVPEDPPAESPVVEDPPAEEPVEQLAATGAPSVVAPAGMAALLLIIGLSLAWFVNRRMTKGGATPQV